MYHQGMSEAYDRIPRGEALEVLSAHIDTYKFSAGSAEADVRYVTNVLQWLLARFVFYDDDPRISSDYYDGYPAAHLPVSVRSLFLSQAFADGMRYERTVSSTLRLVPDKELVPARLPMLDRLRDQGLNYPQIIDYFSAHPDELEGSSMAKSYLLTKYAVSFNPNSAHTNEWGIRLVSDGRDIRVYPFGKDGETEPAVNWMLTYHERPHILAEVVAHVGLLTVQHATHVKQSIEAQHLEEVAVLADNRSVGSPLLTYTYDGSTTGLILKMLVEQGVVAEDDLKK